ncbi:LIN1-like protein [Daldinia childiae]|uniref:LIN1-like protein n=1 Tax=Daldinia childiae TaxID=326645 RepID=UPI001446FCAE|nr:LIN1-like protein [Daldinia childiae]KAF3070541.1 LIN1-like protein [Daldinia childiae]
MSSRFSAARPKRAGENYARAHHAEPNSKKVKFDMRNPSALAPDAEDEDDEADNYLEVDAEIIRGSAATKRGAVNIDGYDSDSDQEELGTLHASKSKPKKDDEDMDDMFAAEEDDTEKIEGQEAESKSGGHVRLDGESSDDDDEEAIELAIQEEGLDEEIGAGGLKKHAPKVEAFNLKAENEEGRFDEAGNFVRKAVDPDAVHDRWLEGVSKKDMKKAAEAHEKREAGAATKAQGRRRRINIRSSQTKTKKVPKWKQKKQKPDAMEVDAEKAPEDPEQTRIKEAINTITEASDRLLGRDRPDIYDRERERLIREYTREADEPWVEPQKESKAAPITRMWEFRWIDGRDNADKQGPFDGPTMKAWQDAGYFGEGVEFREAGEEGWTRLADFV